MSQSISGGNSENTIGSMQYRTLGRTQLVVSIMGFGASPLGDVFGAIDPAEGMRAVHLAIDQGINYFDVSPYYGLTLAEERLGRAIEGRRKGVILSTKCGRYGEASFDFSAERIRQSVDESLRRLRTDYVDLLQAHDVEFGDVEQIIHETIPEMRRLQQQGKARYIGITGYPLGTLVRIAEAVPLDSIISYCRYNLLVDDMDAVLMPVAKKHGIGVINASGLHMGVLTEGGAPSWHPAPAKVREAGSLAAEFCRSRGFDLAELALRFCFDYPLVASTLVGMSTPDQVRRNLHVLSAPADPEMVQQVRAILAPVFNYVWPSGRRENSDPVREETGEPPSR
ncbi:MAG: aldo/keto reductase [Acidobacteriales bacterium]|nr:aldo/keto reductase [Terriglobales bacterium]